MQGLGRRCAEREKEQATSDQQTAEGALKAARDAVRVFGKTDAEIDQMIASRKIDPALVVRVRSPARSPTKNAQPGFLVQPGNRAGALFRRRRLDQMDAGECHGK